MRESINVSRSFGYLTKQIENIKRNRGSLVQVLHGLFNRFST